MPNETVFTLVGTDEDDNTLFYCSYCGSIIPLNLDDNGDIEIANVDETCPECGATIYRIDLD